MIVNPGKIEQALCDQVGRLDLLVFDDYRVVILRDSKGINPPCMLRPSGKLRCHQPAIEYHSQISFDQGLKIFFLVEVGLLDSLKIFFCNLEQRHRLSLPTRIMPWF